MIKESKNKHLYQNILLLKLRVAMEFTMKMFQMNSLFYVLFTTWTVILFSTNVRGIDSQQRYPPVTPKCHSVQLETCTAGGSATTMTSLSSRRRGRTNKPSVDIKWRYQNTTLPNFLNDFTEEEVTETMRKMYPLLKTQCSQFIRLFFCSVATPVCTPIGVVPPCRELCTKVKNDCIATAKMFDIEWPVGLSCDMFPSYQRESGKRGHREETKYSIGEEVLITSMSEDDAILIQRAASMTWVESLAANGQICIPPIDDDVITSQIEEIIAGKDPLDDVMNTNLSRHHNFGTLCPVEMKAPPSQPGYEFLNISNCSSQCPNMYLSPTELDVTRYLILLVAAVSTLVTLFTICTFLIDRDRFQYPEKPMVFYSISYLVVSLIFIVGFFAKENIACNAEVRDPSTNEIVQGFTVVKGGHKRACTIIFMILYYFTVSGAIWWLIITFTLLLSAGLKWASESIEKYTVYFHAVAWTLPGVQTLSVVIFGKIEGDNIAGVCFVGIHDSVGLRFLVLLPLAIYLLIGIVMLFTGFVCLCPIAKILKDDEVNRRKHDKYRVRLAIFSTLYILPQLLLFGIYVVEDRYRDIWEATWYKRSCDTFRVPCPAEDNYISKVAIYEYQPHVTLFCAKYVLILIVALAPLIWVASKKTLLSWKDFICVRNANNKRKNKAKSGNKKFQHHNDSTMPLTSETLRTIADGADDRPSVRDEGPIFNDFGMAGKFGSSASVAVMNSSDSSVSTIPSTDSSSSFYERRERRERRIKSSSKSLKPVEVMEGTKPRNGKEFQKIFPAKKSSSASTGTSSRCLSSGRPAKATTSPSTTSASLTPVSMTSSAVTSPVTATLTIPPTTTRMSDSTDPGKVTSPTFKLPFLTSPTLHNVAVNHKQSPSSIMTSPETDEKKNNSTKNSNTLPSSLNGNGKKPSRPPPPLLPKPALTTSILNKYNNSLITGGHPPPVRLNRTGRSLSSSVRSSKENVVEV